MSFLSEFQAGILNLTIASLEYFIDLIMLGVASVSNKMSTRNIPWRCKGGRCLGLTTYHLHVSFLSEFQAGILNLTIASLEFFIDLILPGVASVSNKMSTRNILWGCKGGRCLGLTILPPSCILCLEMWGPQTSASLRASNRSVQGLIYLY